jgi:hypothetical protein
MTVTEMTIPLAQNADTNSGARVTSVYGSKMPKWWDTLLSPRFLVNILLVSMFFGGT